MDELKPLPQAEPESKSGDDRPIAAMAEEVLQQKSIAVAETLPQSLAEISPEVDCQTSPQIISQTSSLISLLAGPEDDITSGAGQAEREEAKTRADRAWSELKSMAYMAAELDNSVFAGPGRAELKTSLGHFRLFRTNMQSSSVLSSLLKLNLMLCAILVFFFAFQVGGRRPLEPGWTLETVMSYLPSALAATLALAAGAGVFWLLQRPKRLKVLPNMMVLRTDLNERFFSELIIPWSTVQRVELTHKKPLVGGDIESRIEISTALGVRHSIPLDDLLVDNSEAAFVNSVRTWAPWAARGLTFKRPSASRFSADNGRLTDLWLHQFNSGHGRKESGLLVPGTELQEEGAAFPARKYIVQGVLGGGGQGNTYLATFQADNNFEGLSDVSAVDVVSGSPGSAAGADQTAPGLEPAPGLESSIKMAGEVVLKEYIMPVYRGSAVLANLSEKLADEANLLARLNHPLVVKVWHHFVCDYRGYLVLEYVEGRSLKQLVASEGAQPESFVIDVGRKLLQVLNYMHGFSPPIVHRDLTPDNIMLSVLCEIKVVDFNVARQLEGSTVSTVVGKHAYIPPEQFRGRPGPASDIYALGGTLHFLLTGQDPEPLTVCHPTEINANVSVELDCIVARATGLELADRYASASEMLADLSRL